MSKYSSDSGSSEERRRKRKHKRRSRSSSSSSVDSKHSSRKKYSRSKRSRERRSRSRDKYRSRRDRSREKSSRSAHSSRSSSAVKKRVSSRDKSPSGRSRARRRSRSTSKERSRRKSRSTTSSRSPSPRSLDSASTSQARSNKRDLSSEEQLKNKLEQAVKAAQLANNLLHQQGLISGAVAQKTPSALVLDEINRPGFAPKSFIPQSSYSYTQQPFGSDHLSKILSGTPEVPNPAPVIEVKEGPASIFHPNLMVDPEHKLAKWAKKLFQIRQKALHGDPLT